MSRYIGILREKEFGVNPEKKGTYEPKFINAGSCSLDAASDVYMEVPTMEETPRRAKKGFYSPEGEMEQTLDLPTAPYFLEALMGAYVFKEKPGSSSGHERTDNLNAHFMYVNAGRRLPSYSIYVGKENEQASGGTTTGTGFEHRFHGCVASSGSFEISDDLATYNLSFNCQRDAQGNLRPDSSISVSEEYPLAFYEVWAYRGERTMKTVQIKDREGSTSEAVLPIFTWEDISLKSKGFTWELDNGTDPETGKSFGSMFPSRILAGTKEPSLTSNVEFEGPDNLRRFWGLDKSKPEWTEEGKGPTGKTYYFSYRFEGQDENNNYFEMLFPKCYFKTVPQALEGSDLIESELEIGVLKDKVCFGRPEDMPNWSVSKPTVDLNKVWVVDTSCIISVYNTKEANQTPPETLSKEVKKS